MQNWFAEHPIVAYIVIFILLTYVYNRVFRVNQKLPIGKEIVLYVMMALGSGMLLIFQHDKLPIIQCLLVAVGLMLLVRVRYMVEARQKRKAAAAGKRQ
ncbi:YlaH-like family protein [Paenibacillus sonchi]|uniref:YlaH-like family protein n=1 Tax=Paenibacillus sonchi TaxID=373687 RepID=A0A974PDE0_9BACL|nr:YlaH-like family protein [Paenibacillus sonchi]MCE3202575.1 YlaH-like family protein [Paenibacillus sonchi]QQZ61373.1 YlaH-like family protein [Paenibacillus sonchi]